MKTSIMLSGLVLLTLALPAAFVDVVRLPQRYSAPGVFGDLVIFSQTGDEKLFAVDKRTNSLVWTWSSGNREVRTKPTIVDGLAYIWAGSMDKDSRACAVDCRSGKSIWETRTNGFPFDSAAFVDGVVLFPFAAEYDEIEAFDARTGRALWHGTDTRMLLLHGGTVLAATNLCRSVAMLDARTGKALFKAQLTDEMVSEPQADCGDDGLAIVGCKGTLLALDMAHRKEVWRKSTGQTKWVPSIHSGKAYLLSGYVFLAEDQKQGIEVLSVNDGRTLQQGSVEGGDYTYFPAQVFGDVMVVASDGKLFGLSVASLQVVWDRSGARPYEMERSATSLYLGYPGPRLCEIDPQTGKEIWKYE